MRERQNPSDRARCRTDRNKTENERGGLLLFVLVSVLTLSVLLAGCNPDIVPSESPLPSQSSSDSSAGSDDSSSQWEVPVRSNEVYTPEDAEADASIDEKLRQAVAANEEVVGWLNLPGSGVDYAVTQTDNNDFYLKHNAAKESTKLGSIFAHYNNVLNDPYNLPRNTVLFGHNTLVAEHPMFGELEDFYDLEYAQQHQYLTLTLGGTTTYWKIFAVLDTEVGANSQQDFYYWNTFATPASEWSPILEEAKNRSLYDYAVDVDYTDNVLTLSTCSYQYRTWLGFYREDVRLVVMARLVREGELLREETAPVLNEDRREPVFS